MSGEKIKFILLIVPLFVTTFADAQYISKKNDFASTITTSAYYTPPSDFTDTSGNYAYDQLGAGLILPLAGRLTVKDRNTPPGMWEVFLSAGFTVGVPEINLEYTFRPRTLYNGSAGLTGLYYFGKNNTLLGGVYSFAGEDQLTYENPDIRYGGFAFINHYDKDKKLSYKIGGLYTYILGRGIPFPIAGFTKSFSDKFSISMLFPQSLSFILSNKEKNRYSIFIKPWGGFNNFNNELQDIQFNNGLIPVIQVRRSEIRSGADAQISMHKNLKLKLEAGAIFYRHLGFYYEASNSGNDLFTTGIEPGAYFQAGLSWKLPRKKSKVENRDKDPHFSFIDLSNFELDGIDLNDLDFDKIDFGSIDLNDIDLEDFDIDDIIQE